MKKTVAAMFGVMLIMCMMLTGCTTSKSYTFDVETGDKVKVELDTSNGLKLTQEDGSFSVTKGDEQVVDAMFITADMRTMYVAAVKDEDNAEIVSDTAEVFSWTLPGEAGVENDRIIAITGTDKTYIIAGSVCEDESLREEAFKSLTFTAE